MLYCAYLELASIPRLLHLKPYHVSNEEIRYFCDTCGAHLLVHSGSPRQYRVASGAIEHSGNVIKVMGHEKVAETIDGGLYGILTDSAVFKQRPKAGRDKSASEETSIGESDSSGKRQHKLKGRCHCGGVEFVITPPTSESSLPSSPWPDLLVPYHSSSPRNDEDVKWWVRCGGAKYLAGLCACQSCRLGAGFPIQSWAFVPKKNIEKADGKMLDFQMGSLKQFESSPGVYREFCDQCGATVFWHCEERPELIDVSVGLLRAEDGALAREWLDWHTGRVSFAEEAQDSDLVGALEASMRS